MGVLRFRKHIYGIIFLYISLESYVFASETSQYPYFPNIWNNELALAKRIGLSYSYQKNTENITAQKKQYTLFSEYFFGFYGIYIAIPYTEESSRWQNTRYYLDHIRLQNKLQWQWKRFLFLGGVIIDFPRNSKNNRNSILPGINMRNDIGYIEPYLGSYFSISSFLFKFSVHWNTQTNSSMKERRFEKFERTWVLQASAGWTGSNWAIWLETQYRNTYHPRESAGEVYFYGTGLSYSWKESFRFSLFYGISSRNSASSIIKPQIEIVF